MGAEGRISMKNALKYLAAGAIVYGVFVACGGPRTNVVEAIAEPMGGGQPDRVLPADSNPNRWVGGTTSVSDLERNAELATGPFYLTDARAVDGRTRLYVVGASEACDDTLPSTKYLWYLSENTVQVGGADVGFEPTHGARFLIRSNEKLCLRNLTNSTIASTAAWAGFRPYD
jgi:hypothetical protein